MGTKTKSGKSGKQKKKPSQVRYTGEARWGRNQQRKMRKHFKNSGGMDGQAYAILQSKYGAKGIAGLVDPRETLELKKLEATEKFTTIRSAAEKRREALRAARNEKKNQQKAVTA